MALNPAAFGEGVHEVEVRAVTEDGLSLSSFTTFAGSSDATGEENISRLAVLILLLAMLITGFAALRSSTERPLSLDKHRADAEPAFFPTEGTSPSDEAEGSPPA